MQRQGAKLWRQKAKSGPYDQQLCKAILLILRNTRKNHHKNQRSSWVANKYKCFCCICAHPEKELSEKTDSYTKYGATTSHYTLKLTEKDYRVKAWGMGELYSLPFTTGIHQCLSTQLPRIDNELVSSIHVLMQAKGTLIFSNQGLCWHIASEASSCYSIPLWKQIKSERSRTGWALWTCLGVMYRCLSYCPCSILRKNWK